MRPESSVDPDPVLAQTAAEWVARRDRGLSLAEKRTLAEWENADPRHRAALARAGGAWSGLDGIGAVGDLEAMAETIVTRARARRNRRRTLRLTATALAAAAAVAIGFFGGRQVETGAPASPVVVSENVRIIDSTVRRTTLPDGSVAELNGGSRIEVNYTASERRVRLLEGEAHFVVAKNLEHPFFVAAGSVTVRAVGTAFNVRLASAAVEVLVTEGQVRLEQVAPIMPEPGAAELPAPAPGEPSLVAGQRAVIERSAPASAPAVVIDTVARAEIESALGWQSTRLVFTHTPLHEIVAAFNRYNRHQLTIGDPAIRNRTLSGVFRADNVDGFVRLLRASADVKPELHTPSETVLLPR